MEDRIQWGESSSHVTPKLHNSSVFVVVTFRWYKCGWMAETSSVDAMTLNVHALNDNEKRQRRLFYLVKPNRHQWLVQLTVHNNTDSSRIISEHTVPMPLLNLRLRRKRRTHAPFADQTSTQTIPTLSSWTSWLYIGSFTEICLIGRITIHPLACRWTGQSTPSSRQAVAPPHPYKAGQTQTYGGDIILQRIFLWKSLGPLIVVKQTMKTAGYLNITRDYFHVYRIFVITNENGVFETT